MLISIDLSSQVPIHEQLVASLKELLNRGKLRPGARLPTVRQLAQDLGVNLNTIARAYRELAAQGVLSVRQGRGAWVINTKGRYDGTAREQLRKMAARLANEAVFLGVGPQELHALIDAELQKFTEVAES